MAHIFAAPATSVVCACAADTAEIEVIGMGRFSGSFRGEMGIRTGSEVRKNGLATLPLNIDKHETKGVMEGLGLVQVSHDSNRKLQDSEIREINPGTGFPATQEMYVNIHVTVGALPKVVLRNQKVGVLKCDTQHSFPPQNAKYILQEPLDLEDIAYPGRIVARILRYTAIINP
jgi:hypothetical protein